MKRFIELFIKIPISYFIVIILILTSCNKEDKEEIEGIPPPVFKFIIVRDKDGVNLYKTKQQTSFVKVVDSNQENLRVLAGILPLKSWTFKNIDADIISKLKGYYFRLEPFSTTIAGTYYFISDENGVKKMDTLRLIKKTGAEAEKESGAICDIYYNGKEAEYSSLYTILRK